MIQVCDPPRTRQARRLSAEEFCGLLRSEVSSIYRPRSEVLRMITVGEMWGICGARSEPTAGCILLPMDADTAAAGALRSFLGWGRTAGGYVLTPPVGAGEDVPALLAAAVLRRQEGRSEERINAVKFAISLGASEEKILKQYSKEEYEKALALMKA